MEDVLTQMGLLPKEIRLYILLLEQGKLTAAEIAKKLDEKRSNAYMLLESLTKFKLVEADDTQAVRRFGVTDPGALTQLIQAKQEKQNQIAQALTLVMPRIKSLYSLANDKPGVVSMAGLAGMKTLLNDMARSSSEVLLVASNEADTDSEVFDTLLKGLAKRKAAGVTTRALHNSTDRNDFFKQAYAERGIELRFIGEKEFSGEVVLYEDNTVFTVYQPALIVTIINNARITETMRTLFEELWQKATES